MFWKNKFNGLCEHINTKYLKEQRYYTKDCGCRAKYESVVVEVNPKGDTFEVKTILYRTCDDMLTRAMQPIWDDKKLQARLRKEREDEERGIKVEKKYKPTKYRKLTQKDYRDVLLAYTVLYKWADENLTEDWPVFNRIRGVIGALDFAYRGVADITNKLHNNDINTIELIDLRIAGLTMTRKQLQEFHNKWLEKKHKEREDEEKSILRGLICHKCEIPMEEVEYKHAFEGKGHYCPAWLRGRKCPKCGFEIFIPKDAEHYISENKLHYLIYSSSDEWLKKNKGILTNEIKEEVKKHRESAKKFDDAWKMKRKRDEKVITDIRKKGNISKYFGSM